MSSIIRFFGCPIYIQMPKKKRNKLTNKKQKIVFIGYYEKTHHISKIWDLIDRKIKEITYVNFDKTFSNKSSENLFNSLANNSN